MISYYY